MPAAKNSLWTETVRRSVAILIAKLAGLLFPELDDTEDY